MNILLVLRINIYKLLTDITKIITSTRILLRIIFYHMLPFFSFMVNNITHHFKSWNYMHRERYSQWVIMYIVLIFENMRMTMNDILAAVLWRVLVELHKIWFWILNLGMMVNYDDKSNSKMHYWWCYCYFLISYSAFILDAVIPVGWSRKFSP